MPPFCKGDPEHCIAGSIRVAWPCLPEVAWAGDLWHGELQVNVKRGRQVWKGGDLREALTQNRGIQW